MCTQLQMGSGRIARVQHALVKERLIAAANVTLKDCEGHSQGMAYAQHWNQDRQGLASR